jgi:hypothetical protein
MSWRYMRELMAKILGLKLSGMEVKSSSISVEKKRENGSFIP